MLYRGIGKTALIALLGAALAPYGAGAQGSPVKDLRLLDAGGQPMALIPIEAGDDYYRVPEGTPSITAAFEFAGTQATDVKIKVLGTEGVGLFEESKSCLLYTSRAGLPALLPHTGDHPGLAHAYV